MHLLEKLLTFLLTSDKIGLNLTLCTVTLLLTDDISHARYLHLHFRKSVVTYYIYSCILLQQSYPLTKPKISPSIYLSVPIIQRNCNFMTNFTTYKIFSISIHNWNLSRHHHHVLHSNFHFQHFVHIYTIKSIFTNF